MAFPLLALLLATVFAKPCPMENLSVGDKFIVKEKQLKTYMIENDIFVIGVSANWCRHCCHLEPGLKDIHTALEFEGIPLARIDAGKAEWVKKRFGEMAHLPLLYVVKRGKFYAYDGDTNPEAFLPFLHKMTEPLPVLTSASAVDEFFEGDGLRILGIFYDEDRDETSDYEAFQRSAYHMAGWADTTLAEITDQTLINALRNDGKWIQKHSNVLIKRRDGSHEKIELVYREDEELMTLIIEKSLALVDQYRPETSAIYQSLGKHILTMWIDPKDVDTDVYLHMYRKVAEDFEEEIRFAWVDASMDEVKQRKAEVGLLGDSLPGIAFAMRDGRKIVYPEKKGITVASLKEFCQNFLENKLETLDPAKQQEHVNAELEKKFDQVKRIHYNEFPDFVLKAQKDVLVIFYDSKRSGPEDYILAGQFASVEARFQKENVQSMRFYRMDIANDSVPKNIKTAALPTIYFFPAFRKETPYMHYTGDFNTAAFIEYLEEHRDIKGKAPTPKRELYSGDKLEL